MEKYTTLLEESLESWQGVRMGVVEELSNIPEEHWDFRPVPEIRSVRDLAIHILEVGLLMTGELTRPDTNFHRAPWPKLLELHAAAAYRLKTKQEILDTLRTQLAEGMDRFRQAGELHMLQFIQRFDGKPGTRLAWLHHGIDQEEYHRGQLTVYARLLHLEPALTKRIRGATS